MKNFTRLLLLFAFLCTFFRMEAQITIGTGTSTARYPISFWYQHGRHVAIYTAAEMNTVAAGATITTLTWTAVNATNGGSITIKLLECGAQTTIASGASYATQTAGATTVYTSASFTPTVGANLIDITDFAINANQNLKVIVETDNDPANTPTCGGQGTSTSNTFNYTTSTAGSGAYFDYDDTGTGPACVAGTIGSALQISHRPNITIGGLTPPAAPDCATLNTPTNGATGVVRNTPLTWTAAGTGGTATAFKVYLGTVNPPTTLVSTITAPTATYTPTGQTYNTVYYWYIVPTGPGGDAVGCNATVNSYTTELAPPPPANDNICGAVSLSVSSGVTCTTLLTGQSTENATAGAAACAGSGADDDVWYSFVATSTSHIITLSTSGAGSTDRVHQLYSSSDNTCSGTLTSLTCSDPETSTTTGLTIGNTYFLRVHSYSTGNFATYAICITSPPPPPANDLICGAVSLSISSGLTCTTSLTGQSTQYSTAGAAACVGTGADDDVWYSFVATATSHIITLTTSGAGSTDRVHQLYSSSNNTCSGTLTSLTCSDPETSTTSGLTIGNTYFLRVHSYSTGNFATYDICVTTPPAMTYTSSAIAQQTAAASAGSTYQSILRLVVVTANALNPLQVTQLDFTTAGTPGTSTPADLTNARVYYTSTTSTWTDGAPAGTQFGTTIVNPSGAMSFVGTQALTTGSNYFWLVYDLACGAVGPNIDASMVTNGLTMTGGPYTPTTPDPALGRTVTALSSFTTAANGSWDAPGTWSCGAPPPTGTTTVIINHNVTVPSGSNVCGNLTIAAGKTLTINGGTLVVGTSSAGAVTGNSNRVVTVNGTLTISSGQMDINGSMVAALAGFFNMSGGTLNIDPNDGTSAGSAAGITMSLLNGTNGSVTGGAINFLDPPYASGSNYLIAYNHGSQDATWGTGCTVTYGGGDDTNLANTNGFYTECNVGTGTLEIGTLVVNGGRNNNGATNVYRAMTTNTSALYITKIRNLTVSSGSEVVVRGAPLVITGANLTNNGFITVVSSTAHRGLVFAGDAQYISTVTFTNSAIQQTWSGSGFFKKATADADPGSSDQNAVTSLAFFNGGSSSALTTGSPLSCTNLHLGAGVLNTSSSAPIIVGTGSGAPGTITVAASALSTATTVTLPLAAAWAGGWVNGPVERWFSGVTSGSLAVLPTGSSSTHQIATISFSSVPTTAGKLSATFSSAAIAGGLVISPPLTQGALSITSVSPGGEWLIEPTATSGVTGGTYAANLYSNGFTKTNGAAITLPAETVMLKRPSASILASDWTLSGTHVTSVTAGTGIIRLQRTAVTGFSKFAMGGTTAALPIELKSFTGKALKASNQLEWITSTEEGVKEHIIERSANGYNNWTLVGTTPSKGDAREDQSYSMEDKTPLTKSFYRLRSLDLDGREQFSNVISLTRQNNSFGVIAAYPNPAVEMINVQFNTLEEGNITARIVDMTGRLVLEQQMSALNGTNMFPVQLHGLSAGTYFITLSSDNEVAEPIRFVKQ